MSESDEPGRQQEPIRQASVHEVFQTVIARSAGETVTVGEILAAFGARAYGPILFLIGVIIISPLSAIPGAMILAMILVVVMMAQSMVRKGAPWFPGRIRGIRIDARRMRWALGKVMPWFELLERFIRPRMVRLVRPPALHLWSLCCILIALTLIPLTFIPFAVTVPGIALAVIGLGLMNSDGLVVVTGVAFFAAVTALVLVLAEGAIS